MYIMLCHKCHITASESTLKRKDITFYSWGCMVSVRKTKTIQYKEKELSIPISKDTSLCAVHWMSKHFEAIPASDDSDIVLILLGSGYVTLACEIFQATIKLGCRLVGLIPNKYSTPSHRRGLYVFSTKQNGFNRHKAKRRPEL